MKKLNALLATIAMSFMLGCGGGGSGTVTGSVVVDPMTERDLITIFYNSEPGMCENPVFQDYLKQELSDQGFLIDYYLFEEKPDTVDCATYDRINDINDGCITFDLAELLQDPTLQYDTSCVIGVDFDPNVQPADTNTNIDSAISSVIQGW